MDQITFGPFCLDVAANQLRRDGTLLELRPQALQALRTLLQHSGQYVNYEHMLREAWEGNIVSRHTVAVTVGEVKKTLKEYGSWIGYRPKLGYRLEVPESEDLIRKGWHFWNRQTREGLDQAVACFERAARNDGADFRAWEGLAAGYLRLGVYGMRPPREMYERFLEAHHRAVELGGLTPALRTCRALGLQLFERRFTEAEADLLAALAEEPRAAQAINTLLMLYITMGRFEDARKLTARSHDAHELWPTLPACEAFLRLYTREYDAAVVLGKQAVDLHPFLPLSRAFYAMALEASGRIKEALEQYRLAWVMFSGPTWIRALEGRCLAEAGEREQAQEILESLRSISNTEYVDPYHLAQLLYALGRRDEALAELERAANEFSPTICFVDVDPKLDGLRSHPCFAEVRKRVFPNCAGHARASASTLKYVQSG